MQTPCTSLFLFLFTFPILFPTSFFLSFFVYYFFTLIFFSPSTMSDTQLSELPQLVGARLEEVLSKLCSKVHELEDKIERLSEDNRTLESRIKEQDTKLQKSVEKVSEAQSLLSNVCAMQDKVNNHEQLLTTSKWVDVDVVSVSEWDPRAIYRLSVDEMNNTIKEGWVYASRVLSTHLFFETSSSSSNSYYSRVSCEKKSKWELLPKNAESPADPPLPISGTVFGLQMAVL
eukprot:TRINITY_DN1805_c1_g3_i1.p1 TRINITY_DN1805_c1_g3~~TRINITY_DN1805_c1_g3_i1.p1  ORF type:complete len:231 (+),score=14.31 TRINITY_DN1805_c1_g3_i1:104-796(+)